MKKLITLIMMLALVLTLAACSILPENIKASINGIFGGQSADGGQTGENNGEGEGEGDNTPHVHDFVVVEKVDAACEKEGYEKLECSCGEIKENSSPALEHSMKESGQMAPTCTKKGVQYYKCEYCGKSSSEILMPAGHSYGEAPEASRFAYCTNEGCATGAFVTESNGTYTEQLTFNFTKDHEDALSAKHEEILALLEAAPDYDENLHGYAEEGELADAYKAIDEIYVEYYDMIMYAIAQRQIAEIDYYCNMNDLDLENRYSYMMDYYTALVAKFYSLSQPFYDSCYRMFYYYGMSEEEINAYLFDSSAISNPEYVALKSRNSELELEMLSIEDPINSTRVPELYYEFVQNNNAMAKLMGYDNYLEYAYENVYARDYTYQEVSKITDYVKEYIAPAFIQTYIDYSKMRQNGDYNKGAYNSVTVSSFFGDANANKVLNDYIDVMAFTSNPDKSYSFSDEFNGLMSNGNLFRGQYSGAFVTSFSAFDNLPIAYFSGGYDNTFTVAHEFGHYMNEVYNKSQYNQSYDLLEIHSQGNEMLYLSFLDGNMDGSAYEMLKLDQLVNMLNIVFAGIAIDSFEQAVYLNYYDGYGSEQIMADGQISADEYDSLYYCITEDLGVRGFISETYWRYGMTVTSPCYYVSYSVSALCALQIYEMAETDGFEAASEAYLKLFSYTDVDPDMNMEEVLEYAGMYSYNDEGLYSSINSFVLGK